MTRFLEIAVLIMVGLWAVSGAFNAAYGDWTEEYYDNLAENYGDVSGYFEPGLHYTANDLAIQPGYQIKFTKITTHLAHPGSVGPVYIRYEIIRMNDSRRIYYESADVEGTYEFRDGDNYIFSYEHVLTYNTESESGGIFLIATRTFGGTHVLTYNQRGIPAVYGLGWEEGNQWYSIDGESDLSMRVDYLMDYTGVESTSLGEIKAVFK